jgi:hypothetical protein
LNHFAFERGHQPLGADGLKDEFHENWRADGIEQVRHQFPSGPVTLLALQPFRSVIVEEFELG